MPQDFASQYSAACSEGFTLIELDPAHTQVEPMDEPQEPHSFPQVPLFRLVAALVAEGKGPDVIAEILQLPEPKVRLLIKQPQIAEILNQLPGRDQTKLVDALFQGTVIDSIAVLRDLRDDPKSSAAVRLAATKELLDRALGRPEPVTKTKPLSNLNSANLSDDPAERARQLDEEILRLRGLTGHAGEVPKLA